MKLQILNGFCPDSVQNPDSINHSINLNIKVLMDALSETCYLVNYRFPICDFLDALP